MPTGEIHTRKRLKNWAMLAAILAWVALIWAVAMIRMAGGH